MNRNTEDVHLEPYDSEWPKLFEKEAERLFQELGNDVLRIEHFGSTAVPGLSAKPVIDILIGVRSLSDAKKLIPILEGMGYSYWRDDLRKDGYFLVKGLPPNGPRTHHIHMTEIGSARWERLLFRDYLRHHTEEMMRYETLKRGLATTHSTDREAYTNAKSDYILSVMERARRELRLN